ncbi:MAG: TrkA family potassium uptake protein [Candidatus Aerophobetes bacterium]|nr:TrkA family potassium uptake protein [Candidatus Aerophobetes bacterium]
MRKFAVIGLGQFGTVVAQSLIERGAEIIAVDIDAKLVDKFKEIADVAVKLDSTDEEALKSQGIEQVDVAIVSIGDFETSVLTTAILKQLGIPTVITVATRALGTSGSFQIQNRILKLVGANRIIFPEVEMGKKLAQNLLMSSVLDYVPISEKYSAAEIQPPKPFWNKTIGELKIRQKYKVSILEIKKTSGEGKEEKIRNINYFPQPDDVIEKGDLLLAVGEEKDIERLLKE